MFLLTKKKVHNLWNYLTKKLRYFLCLMLKSYSVFRAIDPVKYGSTRNYINGAVTHLSPYISRGVISTKFILTEVLKKGYKPAQIEKFIQELAWRDYWQQLWIAKGAAINKDLKHPQSPVSNSSISKSIVDAHYRC